MPNLILAALDPLNVTLVVIGLGGLVFVHELGHFVACRLTGTRVEAFSIGFGPMLLGWRRGPTLYKISLIPLGGYVKMAAENPGEKRSGAPDEFPNKSFLQRLFIMSNGVIFNGILAACLFVWAFRSGVPYVRAEIGTVVHGEPAWQAGLLAGDRVVAINGREVRTFTDLKIEVAFSSASEVLRVTVDRGGRRLDLDIEPRYSDSVGIAEIGVAPAFEQAAAGIVDGSPAAKGGGRRGDVIVAVEGRPVARLEEIDRAVAVAAAQAPADAPSFPLHVRVRRTDGAEEDLLFTVPVERVPQLGISPSRGRIVRQVGGDPGLPRLLQVGDELLSVNGREFVDLNSLLDVGREEEPLSSLEILRDGTPLAPEPPEMTLQDLGRTVSAPHQLEDTRVAPRAGMAAERAGLRAGDRVLAVGGTPVHKWEEIREAVAANGMRAVELRIERGEEKLSLTIAPTGTVDSQLGYQFRASGDIHHEESLVGAIAIGWDRTVRTMEQVVLTLRGLLTRRVSGKNIGGPIMIAQATYAATDQGLGAFLELLALISINLAILNLLPIPVLDGGQILLLCAEKVRGKPLPDRVLVYVQVVGLLLILALMVLAFFNDIVRLFR